MDIQRLREYTSDMSLLIVEDSKSMQALSYEFFSKIFDDIDIAGNGQEGLDIYQSKWHDIIITDINMPVMDGIEMLKKIKEIDWDQNVVIFSAYDNSIDLQKLINLNTSHFLKKPVTYKNMLNVIYPLAKKLYIERKAAQLEQKIEEHDAEMRMVMDLIDNGIVILHDGKISEVNQKFLEFVAVDTIGDIQLDSFFLPKEGYLSGYDNKALVDHLTNSDDYEHKVLIKSPENGEHENYYQVNCRQISNQDKYILSFTDISRYEREMLNLKHYIYTDPLTGLPNKAAIFKKITILKRPGSLTEVVILSVKNADKIVKLYGEDVKNQSEQFLIERLKKSLEASGLFKKVFWGSYGTLQFVFITHRSLIDKLIQIIHTTDMLYSFKHVNGHSKVENLLLTPIHKKVAIPHLLQKEHIVKKIKKSFADLT